VPNAPEVFLEQSQPEIDMQLASEGKQIGEGYFDCNLTVTVTAKVQDKVMFLAEVVQSGIFQIRNIPGDDVEPILGVACPNILFPYARETVSNLVSRAGFPPVLLAPINFEALYMQQRAQLEAGNA
jgi:preprotein translocase subunit SecB